MLKLKVSKIQTDQYPLEIQTVEFCLLLDNFITNPDLTWLAGFAEADL